MVFQRGNTYGNRRGRPKRSAALSEFLRAELERAYNGQAISNKERIAQVLVQKACDGNLRAAAWLADRTEGTAPQRVEHSGPGGGPLTQRHEVEIRAVDYRHSIRALAPLDRDGPAELTG
jgi:hypothetical protein